MCTWVQASILDADKSKGSSGCVVLIERLMWSMGSFMGMGQDGEDRNDRLHTRSSRTRLPTRALGQRTILLSCRRNHQG
jgi:hypothetical protein